MCQAAGVMVLLFYKLHVFASLLSWLCWDWMLLNKVWRVNGFDYSSFFLSSALDVAMISLLLTLEVGFKSSCVFLFGSDLTWALRGDISDDEIEERYNQSLEKSIQNRYKMMEYLNDYSEMETIFNKLLN